MNQSVVQVNASEVTFVGRRPGSGFIYDDLGHIVTSYHAVADAMYIGRIVRADPYSYFAVLKIENMTEKIFTVRLGNSSPTHHRTTSFGGWKSLRNSIDCVDSEWFW